MHTMKKPWGRTRLERKGRVWRAVDILQAPPTIPHLPRARTASWEHISQQYPWLQSNCILQKRSEVGQKCFGKLQRALALCSTKNKSTASKPSLNRTEIEPFSLNNTLFWHVCLFTSKLFVKCMVGFDLCKVKTSCLNSGSILQESNIVSDESLVG